MLNGRLLFSSSASSSNDDDKSQNKASSASAVSEKRQITDMKILQTLAGYLWMKDNLEFRLRVMMALGFLVGAKILNVQVPFLFKLAVDWLTIPNATHLANTTLVALFATPTAVLIGYGIARTGASAFNGPYLLCFFSS